MIVISGALVLVALVLLVIGLIGPSLGFVYASIAVSLASFGFLIVGILQRRKEDLPVADDDLALTEGVTAIIPATAGTSRFKGESAPAAASAPAAVAVAVPAPAPVEAVAGKVLVVAGRPRYHVAGCRYLTGKDAEWVEVAVAREEGFTA
ncbi:MAG: hypothetical protein JWM02_2612, partial [Frankiales bacterium]|nr:hypothetical protein [Frankiales bacterium]